MLLALRSSFERLQGVTHVVISNNAVATYSGTVDTKLSEAAPTLNAGASVTIEASSVASLQRFHSLLKFTGLSNLSGGTVSNAVIKLSVESLVGSPNISLRALSKNWVEAQATWDNYSTGNAWQTAGALGATDRLSTVTANATAVAGNVGGYISFISDQLTADIQAFIDGSRTNYGWEIEATNDVAYDGTKTVYNSAEATDGLRPILEFDYVSVADVEHPEFLLLMLF